MWQTPKIPKHGSISPSMRAPESIMDIVRNYLGKQVIIPQPLRENLIPGLIGYCSLYKKTFYFLLENGKALIYSNGFYILFLV
jgi:hypothetical protein